MAGLQRRNGSFRILFRYQGKQRAFTLDGNPTEELARAKVGEVDLKLHQLRQRFISVPPEMDICEFLKYEGRAAAINQLVPGKTSLKQFQDRYIAVHKSSLEQTTLAGIELHFKYFIDAWGEDYPISELSLLKLQGYVDARTKDAGLNGRKLSAATIKKEIVTLRTAWNWAKRAKIVNEPFPYAGLRYPRTEEKPPFMTKKEIERRIKAGGLTEADEADLWDAMYPTGEEIKEILKLVKAKNTQPFLYPMVVFAAFTGARRSEMIRAKVADVDLAEKILTIHEKKRVKGKTTTRRVPICPFLHNVLKQWLSDHPGGQHLFCQTAIVRRSKKRSATTGHQSGKNRAKSLQGRAATIVARSLQATGSITPNEAHHHLKQALAETDWKNVKGWHFFRHGFIGACATKSVDQRFIDEWVGHQTDEQRKRYRHLAPSTQQETIARVFG